MAQRMVANFRRSVSFPDPPTRPSPPHRQSIHVRSASLPCRSCPIISRLRDVIVDLRSWETGARTLSWLCDGLRRLKSVNESLDDLIHLPQTRESLRGTYSLTEELLEDFLKFVDVYGTFQALILSLREEHSAAQMAVRRKDDSKTAVHTKNLRKIAREIGNLVTNFGSIGRSPPATSPDEEAAELIEAMNDVIKVTVSASAAIFAGISNSSAFRSQSSTRMGLKTKSKPEEGIREFHGLNLQKLGKKSEEEVRIASKKMQEMDDLMAEIEVCVERAFRSLISTRVSLLNVLSQ